MKERADSRLRILCILLAFTLCFPAHAYALAVKQQESRPPVPTDLYGTDVNLPSAISETGISRNSNTAQFYTIAPIFADDYLNWHHESVDVVATLRIVSGSSDNIQESKIHPLDGLTRQAAAKMIYLLRSGGLNSTTPPKSITSFSDVSTDSSFAGYISWCQDNQIISGYENGTFRPTDGLTRDAYLKMLLCALGYSQTQEGYVGVGWRQNVELRAAEAGLLDAMPSTGKGTDKVTRSEAILMTFNTLKADLAEYDAAGVVQKVSGQGVAAVRIKSDSVLQFAERYFTNLQREIRNVGLRQEIEWRYKSETKKEFETIGVYDTDGIRQGSNKTGIEGTYIELDAQGGNVLPQRLPVKIGAIYEIFPIPTRVGYTFDGWFDAPDDKGGNLVSSVEVEANKKYEFFAHWTANTVTVRFEPNTLATDGRTYVTGTVRPSEKTVQVGTAYGNLPTPIRDDTSSIYMFLGWYTSRTKGHAVTDTTLVENASDHTLYARWHPVDENIIPAGSTAVDNLTFDFDNTTATQGVLPYTEAQPFSVLYGDRIQTQYFFSTIKHGNPNFGKDGKCYGVAAAAGLFNQFARNADGIDVASFNADATRPLDLSLGDVWEDFQTNLKTENGEDVKLTLQLFIWAAHTIQWNYDIFVERENNKDDYDALVSAVRNYETGESGPIIICVYGINSSGGKSGHALLGYQVDDTRDDETRVYVYDSNRPRNDDCYITFFSDGTRNYTGWEYKFSTDITWGSNFDNSCIEYNSFETYRSCWNQHGSLSPAVHTRLTSANVADAALYNADGVQIASFRNGVRVDENTRDGIYQIIPLNGYDSSISGIVFYLSYGGEYTVKNEETTGGPLKVSMIDGGLSTDAETDAKTVTLLTDDETQTVESKITEPGRRYDITIHDEKYQDGEYDGEIRLRGITGPSGFVVKDIGGTITVADRTGIYSLTCNGRSVSLAGTSGEGETVLLSLSDWQDMKATANEQNSRIAQTPPTDLQQPSLEERGIWNLLSQSPPL